MRPKAIALGALLAVTACAAAAPERPAKVGRLERPWVDPTRPAWSGAGHRPVATTLWYPAAAGATEREWLRGPPGLPILRLGWSAEAADPAAHPQRLPLVVLSHGTGADAGTLSWLAEALAARGMLVAGVTHAGNSIAANDLTVEGFFLFWERADDLRAVIDHVLADPLFGPRVDATRIGAAGFSLGGNSVLLLAGGVLDIERYHAACSGPEREPTSCEPPSESPFTTEEFIERLESDPAVRASVDASGGSFRDLRIRAAYAIAPAVVDAFSPESLAAIEVPVRVAVGTADTIAPPRLNAERVTAANPRAELVRLEGVDHYAFLSRCGWLGRWLLAEICAESGGTPRAQIHRERADDVAAFFHRTLGGAPERP